MRRAISITCLDFTLIYGDEAFLVEMYKHLYQYGKHIFQGRIYRTLRLLLKNVDSYQWTYNDPHSLLEMLEVTKIQEDNDGSIFAK